jgi:hypothetical protein
MNHAPRKALPLACLACLACGVAAPDASRAADKGSPPNWKVSSLGSTDGPGDGSIGPDVDRFHGNSSHLGAFTGAGMHYLNVNDFTFVGTAAYTAADGDQLWVQYQGAINGIDPTSVYFFLFQANVQVVGGTGRLAHATGGGVMTGAFTGVPGDLKFEVLGTLKP